MGGSANCGMAVWRASRQPGDELGVADKWFQGRLCPARAAQPGSPLEQSALAGVA